MQIALWMAAALILLALMLWPDNGGSPPALLVVRDRAADLEITVRELARPGRQVYVLDLGSQDETPGIVRRLTRDLPAVVATHGSIEEAIEGVSASCVLLVRLDRGQDAREAVRIARNGR